MLKNLGDKEEKPKSLSFEFAKEKLKPKELKKKSR